MTLSVTDQVTTLHPMLWHQYSTARTSPNIVHELLGGSVAATIAPARPRRAVVRLMFDSESASVACEQMHSLPRVFTITESGVASATMRYVVAGAVQRDQVPEHPELWFVEIEAQEVPL